MKQKQLVKLSQDISEDVIRQQVESEGRSAKDYFLVAFEEHHLILFWGSGGQQFAIMDDDDVNNFAVAQYLIQHGAPVYQSAEEVPNRKKTNL